jgi:hypothetical protein
LAVFVIAGKARVAIDLVCQCVKFAHTCTRFISGLVQLLNFASRKPQPLTAFFSF